MRLGELQVTHPPDVSPVLVSVELGLCRPWLPPGWLRNGPRQMYAASPSVLLLWAMRSLLQPSSEALDTICVLPWPVPQASSNRNLQLSPLAQKCWWLSGLKALVLCFPKSVDLSQTPMALKCATLQLADELHAGIVNRRSAHVRLRIVMQGRALVRTPTVMQTQTLCIILLHECARYPLMHLKAAMNHAGKPPVVQFSQSLL